MKRKTTLLVTAAVLTVALGVSAWSAIEPSIAGAARSVAAVFDDTAKEVAGVFADDHRRDSDARERKRAKRAHRDDDSADDDDRREHRAERRRAADPAPVGPAMPPPNGLIGNGIPPRVQIN
jgi:hypothetical protein